MFSSQKPYKMNKRRRYEGHKVRNSKDGMESDVMTDLTDAKIINILGLNMSKLQLKLPLSML